MDILIYGFGNFNNEGYITLYGFNTSNSKKIVLSFSLDIQQQLNIQLVR